MLKLRDYVDRKVCLKKLLTIVRPRLERKLDSGFGRNITTVVAHELGATWKLWKLN